MRAGVPSVLHQAPLGTYVGWNVTAAGFNKGAHLRFERRLHSFRENEGGADGFGRSAAVA